MRPLRKAIFAGITTVILYLLVVVLTTPALEPLDAVSAAFQLNSVVIVGMGAGIGLQVFLSEKSKVLGCKLDVKKKALGANGGSTAATSFFSFFHWFPWDAAAGGYTHCLCCQAWLGQVFQQY